MKPAKPQLQMDDIIRGFAEVQATLEKIVQVHKQDHELLKKQFEAERKQHIQEKKEEQRLIEKIQEEQKRLAKEREEEQKRIAKEREEEQKRLAKEREEEQKRLAKEREEEQKRLAKEREEEQKRLAKEREEEQKRKAKEREKEEKKRLAENERLIAKEKLREKENREFDERMKKLQELVGSSQNNMADVAEEAFYQNLNEEKKLGSVVFDSVGRNLRDFKGNEYDLVLENGKYVGVVEVKQKLHPNDVERFVTKKIPTFKTQFTQAQGKHIIGAIGGMAVVPDARKKAEKYGLFVLSQSGDNIKQMNKKDFIPKTY